MSASWTSTTVAGKTVDLYAPVERPRLAVIFLHGIGLETLVGNASYTRLFDELGLACACLHGQRCWWSDRLCPEFDDRLTAEQFILQNLVPFLRQHSNLGPRSLGVFGISMGGQGALRLAFKHPQVFPVVAGIASAIDFHDWYGRGFAFDAMYDSKEHCRQDTATLHVPHHDAPPHIFFCIDPDDVDCYRGNDRLHEKLSALGVAHTCDLTTRAGGHSWDYFNGMADRVIRFVHAGLEQEARRLL